jgi:glycerol kinase
MEIIANVHQAAEQTLAKMSKNGLSLESIKGIGVTNQRETIVAWDS